MKRREYADPELVSGYPGVGMTEEDRRKIDESTVELSELMTRPDLLLYATGQALSATVTRFFATLEELTDEETALRVAYQMGAKHGAANYGAFLANRGLRGGPKAFAEYQDYGHAQRGPRHVGACFAEYDETSVLVKRRDCVYFWGTRGEPNKFIEALERGMYTEGYPSVDPLWSHTENAHCLCKGSTKGCEHRFVFKKESDGG
ncbi:hypothetical protein MK489_07520 [Myxococcota bacterium]|nr:hypothetical protein [Myxococcota bacterium]